MSSGHSAPQPRRLGPYEIVKKLGEGGMGAVYLARDGRLNREVAIKVLPSQQVADADRKRRFILEARAASALNHPNIITIYDVGETEGADYIVMEFVAGRTLEEMMPRGGMPPAEALRHAAAIASALAAAHEAGIVHRDLKPGNIMVSRAGSVKVLDFGLAKLAVGHASAGSATQTIHARTQEGTIVGTVAYMSPEQAESREVDARSDIFSFGATLYEMLTGLRAFQGKTTVSTLASILRSEPRPLAEIAPAIPPELDRIVRRCLKKEPERRFQTAADLHVALQEVAEELQSGVVAAKRPRPRRLRLIGALASLAAVAAAASGWFAARWMTPAQRTYSFRRLTSDSGLTHEPAISPDGKLVAFASDRAGGGVTDIWLLHVAGGDPIRLTHCKANCSQPSFSPDGGSIVYSSQEAGGGIYLISALGGEPRRLADANAREGALPRFAPDGKTVAFRSVHIQGTRLYLVDAAGGTPRELQAAEGHSIGRFVWTPDGRGILTPWFYAPRSASTLAVVPIDGGAPIDTLAVRYRTAREGYNPDSWVGDRLILTAYRGQTSNLVEWSISPRTWKVSGGARPITMGSATEESASASADGRLTVFSSLTTEASGLWRAPIDVAAGKPSGPPVQITVAPSRNIMPYPAANRSFLSWVSQGSSDSTVMLRDQASGREHRVAERAAWPILSSDGRRLAFAGFPGLRPNIYVSGTSGEAVRPVCRNCGIPYHWFAGNSKLLYDHADPQSRTIEELDAASGAHRPILRHASNSIYAPHLSPDEKWVSFVMVLPERKRRIYVAPFTPGREIPEKEWILVLDGADLERQPFWPPVGDLIYFIADRDGFRCIWALALDKTTRKPSGQPFPVLHFHDTRYTMMPFGNPGYIGLSLDTNSVYFALQETRANVWLAQVQ